MSHLKATLISIILISANVPLNAITYSWFLCDDIPACQTYRVEGSEDGRIVGQVYCTKMCFLPYYVLYNGFVIPAYRKNGYAKKRLTI